jgi:glycosyltransferase involved in cell wall biosynthesis
VIADVDDLVFDLGHAREIRALETLTPAERRDYVDRMSRLGRTLRAVDGVVVSTEPLRDAVRSFNDRVAVSPNAVSAAMVSAAMRVRPASRVGENVTLAYLSGTPTHDRDFLEAADAVLWTLEHVPYVELLVVGYLNLDDRFDAYSARVHKLEAVPWRRLPAVLAAVDVNLAPLEPGSRFTDAKSCLKYLEAAIVGVPTVASATSDFRRALEPGVSGFLAGDDVEWRAALDELIASAARRREIGLAAREDVLAHHTTAARAPELIETFRALMASP